MIPILYDETETQFNSNGIGRLSEAISAKTNRGLNGEDELTIIYPEDGIHRGELENSRIILAKPSDRKSVQPYRIYKVTKQTHGRVQVNCEHFGYRLNYIPCMPFDANNCAAAMSGLKYYAVGDCPFTFITDISASGEYKQDKPEPIRARLMGSTGSVLGVYGGELDFDWYTVRLKANIGVDHGVTLRYGKNIIDLRQESNIDKVYTAILPYVSSDNEDEGLITLPEKYLVADVAASYPFVRIMSVDMGNEFGEDEPKTVSALRQKAETYLQTHNVGVPDINIAVQFAALWQTEEYKDVAALERVDLGDTVTVSFERLGIDTKAKVVHTTYDVINERYEVIEIGKPQASVSSIIAGQSLKIEKTLTSTMEQAIRHATDLITGGLGGYVVLKRNAHGKPEEILVMDTDDISTAVNVWRWNMNGWGHSMHGYEGPYEMAATLDNGFVADFIKTGTLDAASVNVINLNASNINTGTMSASRIKAGILDCSQITVRNLSATSITTGTLDCNNITLRNLSASSITTGTLDASRVTVKNINADNISTGTMKADRISGGTLNFNTITVKNLSATDIKSGTLDCRQVTVSNLSASSITTGTLSGDRIYGGMLKAVSQIGFDQGAYLDQKEIDDGDYVLRSHGKRFKAYGAIVSAGNTRPTGSGEYNCGTDGHKWRQVYATKESITTSDLKDKHDVNPISEKYEQLFLNIEPVTYMLNDGDRIHIGAIAQQLKEAMDKSGLTDQDLSAYCKAPKTEEKEYVRPDGVKVVEDVPVYDEEGHLVYDYALRYGEFVMLNTHMIQKLYQRIDALEMELATIKRGGQGT